MCKLGADGAATSPLLTGTDHVKDGSFCLVSASLADAAEALFGSSPRDGAATAALLERSSSPAIPLTLSPPHHSTASLTAAILAPAGPVDGALVTTQAHSYRWACNETMDFFITVLTLTACFSCAHYPLCRPLSVGNGSERKETSPVTFERTTPW